MNIAWAGLAPCGRRIARKPTPFLLCRVVRDPRCRKLPQKVANQMSAALKQLGIALRKHLPMISSNRRPMVETVRSPIERGREIVGGWMA